MRSFGILAAAVGCTLPSWALERGPRRATTELIVLHSTESPACDRRHRVVSRGPGSLAATLRYVARHPVVGAHYFVDRDGTVVPLIAPDEVAQHVGIGTVNARSIAIELINRGVRESAADDYPPAQLQAVSLLIADLARRYGLQPQQVVRHADLDRRPLPCNRSVPRRQDPGVHFPLAAVLQQAFGQALGAVPVDGAAAPARARPDGADALSATGAARP